MNISFLGLCEYYSYGLNFNGSYIELLLVLNVLWFFDQVWNKKFIQPTRGYWEHSFILFKSKLWMLLILTLIIITFHLQQFNRFFILQFFGLYFFLEMILIKYALPKRTTLKHLTWTKNHLQIIHYKLLAIDFGLLILSIFIIHLYKNKSFMGDIQSVYASIVLIGLWFFFSIWTKKFESTKRSNIFHFISPFIRTCILLTLTLAFILFVFNINEYSRILLFGPIFILGVFEVLVFVTRHYKNRLEVEDYDAEWHKNISVHLSQKKLVLDNHINKEKIKNPVIAHLKEKYLKGNNSLFKWISSKLDLSRIESDETTVLDTHTLYNLQILDDSSKTLIINMHPANDFGRINTYLVEVYKKLINGGYFIGNKTTLRTHHERIYRKYPQFIAHVIYAINFITHRILPKISFINLFYFAVTKGRNRLISNTEMLGRLSYCGFRIINFTEINRLYYFIAQKYKTPSRDTSPSYGPIIKLKRIGAHGRYLEIYKFRTMHPYSEYIQDFVYAQNQLQNNGKIKNDYRLTQWGKVMRKYWIDELPQIFNLIRGDLKLVGVRALSFHYYNLYPRDVLKLRMKCKPGIMPPYYADMPKSFDEIVDSERQYLLRYQKKPFTTDLIYFFKIINNILFKNARSR